MTVQTANKSKAEIAYSWIREKIRTREYEPGHRLVLSSIADELSISVVPVREAIRQLEAEGQVTYERNVGARVSTYNQAVYFETMETVAVLEGRATALSAPLLDAQDIAEARRVNDKMRALLDDFEPVEFTQLNKEFHRVLFRKCPNSRLVQLLFDEWENLEYHRVSTFRYVPHRARDSVTEHDRLVALIEAQADQFYIESQARNHRLQTSVSYRKQLDSEEKLAAEDPTFAQSNA